MLELWPAAIFINDWWRMMSNVGSDAVKSDIKTYIREVLAGLADCEHEGPHGERTVAVRDALHGSLGLVSPKPGEATLDQVCFVAPTNSTQSEIMAKLPRIGRAFVTCIRKDLCHCWQVAIEKFMSAAGPEATIVTPYQQLETKVAELTEHLESKGWGIRSLNDASDDLVAEVLDVTSTCARDIPVWERELDREGSTDDIIESTLKLVQLVFGAVLLQGAGAWPHSIALLQGLRGCQRLFPHAAVCISISDLLLDMEATGDNEKVVNLTSQIAAGSVTTEKCQSLTALLATKPAMSNELRANFAGCVPRLAECLSGSAPDFLASYCSVMAQLLRQISVPGDGSKWLDMCAAVVSADVSSRAGMHEELHLMQRHSADLVALQKVLEESKIENEDLSALFAVVAARVSTDLLGPCIGRLKLEVIHHVQVLMRDVERKTQELVPLMKGGSNRKGWWEGRGRIPMHDRIKQSLLQIDTANLERKKAALDKAA